MSKGFTKERLVAILLCIVLIGMMLPVTASAAKLPAPKMKKAVLADSGVKVSWRGSEGASGYRVYRKTSANGEWKAIADVTGKSYVDKKAVSGATNYYNVRALNSAGKVRSNYSEKTVSIKYFKAPKKLAATVNKTNITLTWKAVTGAPLYRIDRKKGSGNWKTIGTSKVNSFVDNKPSNGKTYTYRVRVVSADNKNALSPVSKTVTAIFAKKVAISGVVNKNGYVHVNWNTVKGAAAYRLFRKTEDGDWFTVSTQAGTTYNDYDVVNNVRYSYYVRCLDAAGNYFGQYDEGGKSITYFTSPTMVSCTNANKSLVVKWEAVDGIANYVIYRKIGAGDWQPVGTSTTLSFSDTTAPSGTYCMYTAACADAAGNVVSGYGVSTVGATSYMDEPVLTGIANGIGSISVTWQSVDLAPQYIVYRYIGDTVPDQLSYWTKIGTATGTSYTDKRDGDPTWIQNNRTYWYSVAVRDATDTQDLSMLNNAALSIVYYDPPTIISATNEVDGAMVTWGKVDGASSYKIYRKTGNAAWTQIGTAPATSNTFTDGDVVSTGHYWYSVASVAKNDSAYYTETTGAKDTTFYGTPGASIANGDDYISASWATVDGIGTYRIVETDKNWSNPNVLYTGPGLSYTYLAPTPGKAYYFMVCSIDGGNRVSGWRKLSIKYLSKPDLYSVSWESTKGMHLKWTKVTGADYYDVYMKDYYADGWPETPVISKVKGDECWVTINVPSGARRQFRIVAVSSGGSRSVYSDVLTHSVP